MDFPGFPTKRYTVIYLDPPWAYEDEARAGNRGAVCKYPVMSNDDLCTLPIPSIAEDDCAMFMWVTMPKLNEVWRLLSVWGFEYKTVAFTWVKRNPQNGTWFWGMGRWTRANPELCLLATKGKPKRQDAGVHSIIESAIGEHSEKPFETRERIVKLMGDVPRIELFGRVQVEGWDVWGNDIDHFVKVASLDL
jgi:N6-adenosine-specific RNA methylase IME4